ncbi:MAG: hypothetical protein WAZ75_01695 [Candidatus Absconditicoccaceae bacterium]
MNSPVNDLNSNKAPNSIEIFNELTLVFDFIKTLLSSGMFQFEDGRKEFIDNKKSFFILLNEIIGDINIEKKIAEKYDINYIKGLKDSDFSLMFDIYKLLENYFESQYKPLDENAVIPKLELLQILEVLETLDRSDISSLFGIKSEFDENNCYEVFENFDWNKYDEGNLKIKIKTLKGFLKSKISKDPELNNFVRFLIKDIKDYIEETLDELKLIQENEENIKMNNILKEAFFSGIKSFDEFILWAKTYIKERLDLKNIESFEDLKKDKQKYASFLEFRKDFYGKYTKDILAMYKRIFEDNNKLKDHNYSYILYNLTNLGELYSNLKMSKKHFFVGLKNNFLLGDIYEFLDNQRKNFPGLEYNISGSLLAELDIYSNKTKLIL